MDDWLIWVQTMLVASYFAMAYISIAKINQSNQKVLYPTKILNSRFQIIGYSEMLDHGQPWISRKEARIQSNSFKRKKSILTAYETYDDSIKELFVSSWKRIVKLPLRKCVLVRQSCLAFCLFICELLYFKSYLKMGFHVIKLSKPARFSSSIELGKFQSNLKIPNSQSIWWDTKLTSKYLILLDFNLIQVGS